MMHLAETLLAVLRRDNLTLATAESCTGGMIAAALTDIPGASEVFGHGFVTYSNVAKTELLGIPAVLIAEHGAVSAQVANAMAAGALTRAQADVSVAVTGIAGPGGGSAEKPVGLVYIAVARGGAVAVRRFQFSGDRKAIRTQSTENALQMVLDAVQV